MKIALSGASGFIGKYITESLSRKGHVVVVLERKLFQADNEALLIKVIAECDVVINLAGAPINHRWKKSYKKELYESRIGVTKKIVTAINSLKTKPRLMISASAVGYYPSEGCFDEYNSKAGDSFLSKLCIDWENESRKINSEVRLVNTRFGIVLAKKGGALEKMCLPCKVGFNVIMGKGNQMISWIDIDDLAKAIEFIIDKPQIQGTVNLTAPQQLSIKEFMITIGKHFHCKFSIRIPNFVMKVLMGESSQLLLDGQCVKPTKLIESGFTFSINNIQDFIEKRFK